MEDYSQKTEVEKRVDALNKETARLMKEYKETKKKIDDLYSAHGLDAARKERIKKWMEEHPMPAKDKAEAEKAIQDLEVKFGLDGADGKKKSTKGLKRRGRLAI